MIRMLFRGLAGPVGHAGRRAGAAQSRLFSADTPLRLTLTAPFPTLIRAAKAAKPDKTGMETLPRDAGGE